MEFAMGKLFNRRNNFKTKLTISILSKYKKLPNKKKNNI
jgi:hypothetical protein